MHLLDMSNIARQYIHVSYIDVFNIFFIVTTFTLNIFYIVCYLDEQLPRHIALTVHQVAFNQEIQASFRFPCRSNSVCASFARRFPCNLTLGWNYDRYGISFLSLSFPLLLPSQTKRTARHNDDEEELQERLQRFNLETGAGPQSATSGGGGEEPTLHSLTHVFQTSEQTREGEHRSMGDGPACSPTPVHPFES